MKKAAFTVFCILSILLFVVYLLSCLTPYISPASFWPMTFLGLAFPMLVIATFGCIITWFIVNRRIAVALTFLFFAGYKNITAVFAFRLPSKFRLEKESKSLRILSWNVRRLRSSHKSADSPISERRLIINYMREVNADIILMQEFLEIKGPDFNSNINFLRDSLGYKYYYTSADQVSENNSSEYGCAIFSKIPIENPLRIPFFNDTQPESLSTVDVIYAGKKIRLATTHLVSLDLGEPPNNVQFFGRIERDFILQSSQFEKLIYYDAIHGVQAHLVRSTLDKSPYPLIVTGDFNSVAGSYAYYTIKSRLQDAFVEKGFGFGRTYIGLSPTLRIDFILADKQFKVIQYSSPRLYLSDHFPVIADLKWK